MTLDCTFAQKWLNLHVPKSRAMVRIAKKAGKSGDAVNYITRNMAIKKLQVPFSTACGWTARQEAS